MSPVNNFLDLATLAREKLNTVGATKVAVVLPKERKHLEAPLRAASEGLITPIFLGSKTDIEKLAASNKIDIGAHRIMDSSCPLQDAAALAEKGEIGFIMTAGMSPRQVAHQLFKNGTGFNAEGKVATHIAIIYSSKCHKMMYVTDAAVFGNPDSAQKITIIENAAGMAQQLGVATPKVALLAAVEAIYPAMPVTMEEAAIAKMADRGQIKNVLVDGPLSLDVSISAEVAHQKGIKNSPVAGDADIFVGPSMETAYGIYQAMVMYAGAEAGSVIYGGKVPIATCFASDSVTNIYNSLLLGIVLS